MNYFYPAIWWFSSGYYLRVGRAKSVFQRIEPSRFRLQEILEKALGGLRHKLQGSRSNLVEAERYRKQQLLLEKELSRVRVLLAHNSKVGTLKRSVGSWNRGLSSISEDQVSRKEN